MILTFISALLFAAIAWFTTVEAIDTMHRVSNMLRWPHYPFMLAVALGSALFAVVLLIQTIQLLRGKKPEKHHVVE